MTEKIEPACLKYSEIEKGSIYSFERLITREDVLKFANLTGDLNPIHIDPNFANRTPFNQNIAHGMLVASLFSTLVGMKCPGQNGLYLSQTLEFKVPIFYGDTVTIEGEVMQKIDAIRVVTLRTRILKKQVVAIQGEAKIKVFS